MPRVVHFEFPTQDPARATKFYESVFGWKIQRYAEMDYYLAMTGEAPQPGIDGGFTRPEPGSPFAVPVCIIDVPNADEYAAKITDAGGQIVLPKMAVPTVGYLVYARDTEGVVFGIMQFDKAAA